MHRPLLSFVIVWSLFLTGCAQPSGHKVNALELFAYDRELALKPDVKEAESTAGYNSYLVTYRSARDNRVPGYLVLPKGKEGEKLPCIILMHGLGGNKTMFKAMWPMLTAQGYALFAIDAANHGDRKGPDTEAIFGVNAYYSRDALAQTVVDLRRAVDYLESRPDIDPNRIGYIGASMGGILGAIFAGVEPRVKAPVLLVAGGNYKVLMEKSVLSPLRAIEGQNDRVAQALKAMDAVDPVHYVGMISPRPVLFINGDADDVVPPDSNRALHEAAREPKEIVWYKGGHIPPPTMLVKVTEWLNKHVKGSQ